MSWRTVVVTGIAKLDLKLNYLVVRGDTTRKIHVSEIAVLILENTGISITAALLCELTKRKVKVIFCDEKRNPISELMPYYGSHDTSIKVRNQISWTQNIKGSVWTEIVYHKISKQLNLLEYLGFPQALLLSNYLVELEFNDESNREGHAAKVYFNALFGKGFSRTADCATNACLNYGYGILLSCFNREIVANGYITQLGIHHNNTYNYFNLSSDLMEPFRPLVDLLTYKIQPKQFGGAEKLSVVGLLSEEVKIDDQRQYLGNAIKIYCKSIFDALNQQDVGLIRMYQDELQIYESHSVL